MISWCAVLTSLPDFERYKPGAICPHIQSRATSGGVVGYYKFALPSMGVLLESSSHGGDLARSPARVFYSDNDVHFVMPEADYQQVRDQLPVKTYVLARQPMSICGPRTSSKDRSCPVRV